MGKAVTIIIVIGMLALAAYVVLSGLPSDVLEPFTPPKNP